MCERSKSPMEVISDHIHIIGNYLPTADLLALPEAGCSVTPCLVWDRDSLRSQPLVISTTDRAIPYVHNHFSDFSSLHAFLKALYTSDIYIESLELSAARLEWFMEVLKDSNHLFHFSSHEKYMCNFYFPDGSKSPDGDSQLSNTVRITGGSVRLFKRSVASLQNNENADPNGPTASVAGIVLDSRNVWIVRVSVLDEPGMRIDIKAGTTKSDVLRVPTGGSGTWSDLVPVGPDFGAPGARKLVFLIELIIC